MSALDLAKLTNIAIKDKYFLKIISTKKYTSELNNNTW